MAEKIANRDKYMSIHIKMSDMSNDETKNFLFPWNMEPVYK